jgi:predicted nicotinamide N-methyase
MNPFNSGLLTREFDIRERKIRVFLPDPDRVRVWYDEVVHEDPSIEFPFWSVVWPSAVGLCHFISSRPELIRGRRVLELAAGLGLPSLYSVGFAESVCCSDNQTSAMELAMKSVISNGIVNMECRVLDWNQLPADIEADVLLLSDVNYDPAKIPQLYIVCERFLQNGSTIILSTPVRIVANNFISLMEAWCRERVVMDMEDGKTVHVFVFRKR